MDVKFYTFLLFSLFVVVNCNLFDNQHLIDTTRHLQDIEKYGSNYTHPPYNSIYPKLSNFTDAKHGNHFSDQRSNGTVGESSHLRNNSSGFQPHGFNATESFLNKTISGMAKGVCIKEVP